MTAKANQIDRIDRKILKELEKDGRMPAAQLSEKVGLSKSPVMTRIRRLETAGYIKGYTARLDHDKLGDAQTAFVQVTLSDTTTEALEAFNAAVCEKPEIVACHMIAGSFDYLLKVRTKDIASYRKTLGESIARLPYAMQTSTFMVMEAVKEE